MIEENRATLLALRDQAAHHASTTAKAIDVASNRTQHIILTATAMEAESILAAIDIALSE